MINRICALGTPRCGSQYITQLISGSYPGMVNLEEPFTIGAKIVKLDELNNLTISNERQHSSGAIESAVFLENAERVLSLIETANQTQPIILKIFNNVNEDFSEIFQRIKNCNFKLFAIKRLNVEYQLLSMAVSSATGTYHKLEPADSIMLKVHVRQQDLELAAWLYSCIEKFNTFVDEAGIESVRYESAAEDIPNILGIPHNTSQLYVHKQSPNNPYDQVENADEVRTFIKNIVNGT